MAVSSAFSTSFKIAMIFGSPFMGLPFDDSRWKSSQRKHVFRITQNSLRGWRQKIVLKERNYDRDPADAAAALGDSRASGACGLGRAWPLVGGAALPADSFSFSTTR